MSKIKLTEQELNRLGAELVRMETNLTITLQMLNGMSWIKTKDAGVHNNLMQEFSGAHYIQMQDVIESLGDIACYLLNATDEDVLNEYRNERGC